jgi:hypothetical protein
VTSKGETITLKQRVSKGKKKSVAVERRTWAGVFSSMGAYLLLWKHQVNSIL